MDGRKTIEIITCERCGETTPKRTYATKHCLPCADAIAQARVGNLTATKPIVATATAPQVEPITTKATARDAEPEYDSKTEARYADQLEADRLNGKIRRWRHHAVKLRLAKRTHFTPDFFVVTTDGLIELVEVKGSWKAPHQEDARVKIKTAAEMYPEFQFVAVTPDGSGFAKETF